MNETLTNRTIRAVVVLTVMAFSAGCIVWLIAWGVNGNSLHASALSWSYTLLGFGLTVLIGDAALFQYLQPKASA